MSYHGFLGVLCSYFGQLYSCIIFITMELIQVTFSYHFLTDNQNKASLDAIENAIFVLCLDKPPPPSTQAPSVMEMPSSSITARQCLHGDGTSCNSANRWFDKITQVKLLQGIVNSREKKTFIMITLSLCIVVCL